MELATSLELQTVKPLEWFIVGDRSTEWAKSKELPVYAKFLEATDTRQATKKNLAIEVATTDYVLVIDADQEAEPRVIEQCLQRVQQGYKAVTIPEVFQKPKSYLQSCYYFIRELYAENVEGIPRFFRKEYLLKERFDPEFHYAEDPELWNRVRLLTGDSILIESHLIHKEKFSLFYSLRKVRMATKAQRKMESLSGGGGPRRLGLRTIMSKAPLQLLPGVIVIIFLRMLARRLP